MVTLCCGHDLWLHLVLESFRRCAVAVGDRRSGKSLASRLPAARPSTARPAATAPSVAPGATAPSAPPASVAVPSPATPAAPAGLGICLTLDNVGNAGVEETIGVEAAVHGVEAAVHDGGGVDATVDGAGVDGPQATVEKDLGVSLSLTLAPPAPAPSTAPRATASPGATAPGATAPSSAAPVGLSRGNSQEAEELCR